MMKKHYVDLVHKGIKEVKTACGEAKIARGKFVEADTKVNELHLNMQ